MRRILDRYILREVLANWAVVTGVLLVILLTNQIARVLERAAENQYPERLVLELIGLGALQNLSVLVPVGLLLGVVLAFGRLYHDSEMAAALSCGVGRSRIYGPVAALAVVLAAMLAWLTLDLAPHATARALALRNEAVQSGQFSPIAPGRFRTFGGGNAVVYAEGVDADGMLTDVFVERSRALHVEVALAERARHAVSPDGMTHTITLFDGERFEGMPGSPQFRIVRFAEHIVPVRVPPLEDGITSVESAPSSELLRSSDPERRAEFHWRIALPVMCLLLPLLAVPLSRLRPRQGRFARVWLAVLVYFVYSNLLSAGKVWLARGVVPEWVGLWWTHAAIVLVALGVILAPQWAARARHREAAV
ncbi:MAG: LPS export ABC transporter permease LptF [Gammaproteobacteria bacterium]